MIIDNQSTKKSIEKNQEIVNLLQQGTPNMTADEQETINDFIVNNPTTPTTPEQDAAALEAMGSR